ncbi:MAG: NADH-quinone oxidoreductase subunit NuoH [Armatimonadetes bacterium]|nr:NADH-quinone oxidoreductase subunit NuoH [Armatimonadota bacterium]
MDRDRSPRCLRPARPAQSPLPGWQLRAFHPGRRASLVLPPDGQAGDPAPGSLGDAGPQPGWSSLGGVGSHGHHRGAGGPDSSRRRGPRCSRPEGPAARGGCAFLSAGPGGGPAAARRAGRGRGPGAARHAGSPAPGSRSRLPISHLRDGRQGPSPYGRSEAGGIRWRGGPVSYFLLVAVKALLLIIFLLGGFAYMTYGERRIVARMQWRLGPNRTGPAGLLQPIADGLKLLFKEQLMPAGARPLIFLLAPCISLVVALTAFAVIPVESESGMLFRWLGTEPWIADINVAVLFLLGVSSLGVYGIVLGGWSSGNKYALLGAIRSSAQVISYELALGTALLSPIMIVGSLSFNQIIGMQQGLNWLVWYQPVAFVLYWTAAVAEVNRSPFDLPEAEQELGAGYHTEYSGMRFAMFFMAEYVNMITVSAVATTVFLGGPDLFGSSSVFWFLGKVAFFMFVFIWLRATFPRFRYDQLMRIGWQVLLPLGILNLVLTAVGVAFHWPLWGFTIGTLGIVLVLAVAGNLSRKPEAHPVVS